VLKIGGLTIMHILEVLKNYRVAYKNYISVMWSVYRQIKSEGNEKGIRVIFRNGDTYILNLPLISMYASFISNKNINIDTHKLDNNNIKFTYKGINVTLPINEGDLLAVFGNEEYKFLNVDNEIVIDIGANIGDSPIYFALNNAKNVIALEPYSYSYNIALENIKANKLDGKITLLNSGYGKDGIAYIDPEFKNTTSSTLKSVKNGKETKISSLKTLLNNYNINNAVLKMDCEGCEYNILYEDNNTLSQFKRIQIEYHYGYEKIKNRLEEAGFTVKYKK
jgi:FkbM family methyltransferase